MNKNLKNKIKEYRLFFEDSSEEFKIIDDENKINKEFNHVDSFYSWKKFISKYNNEKGYYYRGQVVSDFPLASIFRKDNFLVLQNNNEKKYIDFVKDKHYSFFESEKNIYERYSKMQHYSLPTRLLDITSNPFKALMFILIGNYEKIDFENNPPSFFLFKRKDKKEVIYSHSLDTSTFEDYLNKCKKNFNIIEPIKDHKINKRVMDQDSLFIDFDFNFEKIKNYKDELNELKESFLEKFEIIRLTFHLNIEKIKIIEKKLKEYYYFKENLYHDLYEKKDSYIKKFSKLLNN